LTDITITLDKPQCDYPLAHSDNGIYAQATHIIGFGFDGTACFRKGSRFGPDAIRVAANSLESYSPYLDVDIDTLCYYDLGNIPVDEVSKPSQQAIEQQWQQASNAFEQLFAPLDMNASQVKVLTLGGEHSISYAPIKVMLEQYPDLLLIHLDAHADLRDGYEGFHYSHASIIRRVLDCFTQGHQLIQYGIRSGTKEEYQWMRQKDTLCTSRSEFLKAIAAVDDDRPIYLTLDLDYFDPAYLPGTGTPEAGGEDFHSFISLCKILKQKRLVGCDVVELAPPVDSTGNSDVFAAKVVRELIICLEEPHG
jgi:agmatinase